MFTTKPIAVTPSRGMSTLIIAPHKTRVAANIGQYDNTAANYQWPDSDGKVDLSDVSLVAKDAVMPFYAGSAVVESSNVVDLGITLKNNIFRNVPYYRDAAFYDRDCRVGDIVTITKGSTTVTTTIAGFSGQYVPPTHGIQPDGGNEESRGGSIAAEQISGAINSITISNVDISEYDGTKYKLLEVIYYVRVVVAGGPGVAKLRIRSLDDDERTITAPDWNTPVYITPRGIKITFTRIGSDVFVVGQEWRITVLQEYERANMVCDSSGYSGTKTRTYVLRVVEGGSTPKITFASTDGDDIGGPVPVGTSFTNIGRYGLRVRFFRLPACLYDKFYIEAKPGGIANYTKIITKDQLPPALFGSVSVTLAISNTVAVPRIRLSQPGSFNYVLTNNQISVPAGMLVYENSWTSGGEPIPLPVTSATLAINYGIYRDWLADRLYKAESFAAIHNIPGTYSADNPLKTAAYIAFINSGDEPVYYIAVSDPTSVSSWLAAFNKADVRVYNAVLVASDEDIVSQLINKAKTARDDGKLVALWLPAIRDEAHVVRIPSCQVTITDDGNAYNRLVTLYGATTAGVSPGDELRYNITTDPWGRQLYNTAVVASVLNSTTLLINTGPEYPITQPVAASIVTPLDNDLTRKQVAIERAAKYAQPFVRLVFGDPDMCYGISDVWYGFAAALAGLRSANSPRYPLTDPIENILATPTTLSKADLDELVANGVICVVNAGSDGVCIHDRAVTTAPAGEDTRDEAYAAVADYCYRRIYARIAMLPPVRYGDAMIEAIYAAVRREMSDVCRGQRPYERLVEKYTVDVYPCGEAGSASESSSESVSEAPQSEEPAICVTLQLTLPDTAI